LFVVEGKARAGVADLDQATVLRQPFQRHGGLGRGVGGRCRRSRLGRPVHRLQRVARQQVQQVGEDQFLVLLLVVQAQRQQ